MDVGEVVGSVVSAVGEVFETACCGQCGYIPESATLLLALTDMRDIVPIRGGGVLWMLEAGVCCW